MPPVRENNGDVAKDTATDTVDKTRPYTLHGVDLVVHGVQSVGTCPFCGKAKKFHVNADTSEHHCFVCGAKGNAIVFLRHLWERSMKATKPADHIALATDRKLLDPATVPAWGCCRSIIDGSWLIPGYDTRGQLHQLYKRVRTAKNGGWVWTLMPAPNLWPVGRSHGIHLPIGDHDPARPNAHILEGPWDAMAWWELARISKMVDGRLEVTGTPDASLLAETNVYATPGSTTFPDHWLTLFRGKNVTFGFDSDRHVRATDGVLVSAGFEGTKRNAKKLGGIAKTVSWIAWGDDGYDPSLKDGWDVRDHLTQTPDRRTHLQDLLSKVQPVPASWSTALRHTSSNGTLRETESIHCDRWETLEAAWRQAQEWRTIASEVLQVMLAVATSTQQAGNQLFLQVIGSASSGKTAFCDGLLVSSHCHSLEHLTGFHSGWKKPGEDDKDCSLIARVNGKTLITPEGDVLMSNPRFAEIMSQCRRIFDGTSGATFKNTDIDTVHKGLRTPWIMAGTQALMDTDQSRLGDRFMRIIFTDPTEDEKERIAGAAFDAEMESMTESSNGTAGSILNPRLRRAHALTGGYVDWLRANVESLIGGVTADAVVRKHCVDLGFLTADLRARPNWDLRKHETHSHKEMPYRITAQLGRLARCLAVVRNQTVICPDTLRIVRKVALDTSHGHTYNIVKWLGGTNPRNGRSYQESGGLRFDVLLEWTGMSKEKLETYLRFLMDINVLRHERVSQSNGSWFLTDSVYDRYLNVMTE